MGYDSPSQNNDAEPSETLQHFLRLCGLTASPLPDVPGENHSSPAPAFPPKEELESGLPQEMSSPVTVVAKNLGGKLEKEDEEEAETETDSPTRYSVRIREIPNDERPRERLIKFGADALSTAELLAILLRTGTEQRSAVSLGDYLLSHFNGLRGVAGATIEELAEIPGIGPSTPTERQY